MLKWFPGAFAATGMEAPDPGVSALASALAIAMLLLAVVAARSGKGS